VSRTRAASRSVVSASAVVAVLLGIVAPSHGKEPARPPIVNPRAEELLKQMSAVLAAAKQFSFHAEITFDEMLPSGQKVQLAAFEEVSVRRPDRAFVEYQSDIGSKRLWYDGKRITMYDAAENSFASTSAPRKLDAAVDQLLESNGFQPPLSDFLYGNPYGVLSKQAQLGAYLGLHDAGGHRCHHLAFADKTIDWQIWIEDGAQALPRKLVVTYKLLPGSPQFEALFTDWNLKEQFADAVFTPTIPSGATQIEFATVEREAESR